MTLELGPGCGTQFPRFNPEQLTHVCGIEPNAHIISALKEKLDTVPDLQAIYTPINAALGDDEALKAHGLVDGCLDTVVSMQVMCSVSDPVAAAKQIHKLLKPGGQLLFWEHQASKDGVTRVVQRMYPHIRILRSRAIC